MFSVKAVATIAAVFSLFYSDASFSVRRSGWLDRVIEHKKKEFINEVQNVLPPIQIKATIVSKPAGYVDSTAWDFDSVIRLLTLIRETKSTRDLRRYLRRSLPSRRMWIDKYKSYKHFPSLHKKEEIYYDESSHEGVVESWELDEDPSENTINDDSIVIVSNPVESKLPSTHISVKLLKEILMARAEAAREMPITEKTTYPWKPMNKTTAAAASGADSQTTDPSGQETVEPITDAGGEATAAGGEYATAAGDDDVTAAGGDDATAAEEATEQVAEK